MAARLAAVTPTLVLTEADHQLIASARDAFRADFRYLEQVLWQARARRSESANADSPSRGSIAHR